MVSAESSAVDMYEVSDEDAAVTHVHAQPAPPLQQQQQRSVSAPRALALALQEEQRLLQRYSSEERTSSTGPSRLPPMEGAPIMTGEEGRGSRTGEGRVSAERARQSSVSGRERVMRADVGEGRPSREVDVQQRMSSRLPPMHEVVAVGGERASGKSGRESERSIKRSSVQSSNKPSVQFAEQAEAAPAAREAPVAAS